METLYGLKRKTTNRWLKLLLLLFVAVGFGVPNLNAQTKSIKVADDKQLIEAINNPSIGTIVLEAGFYPTLNTYAESGTRVAKRVIDDSNRDVLCQYYIIATDACFVGTPGVTFVSSIATAGYTDTYGCGCCPVAEDLGLWSVISSPLGSTVTFISPMNQQENNIFSVNMPGMYVLRYTWGPPYNSLVETAYYFYGPVLLELSAPDVCGLTTQVTFSMGSIFPDPSTTVVWKLDGVIFDPDPPGNNTTSPFDLTVAECGVHELSVTATPTKCPPVTKTILIDFACQPIADAGPDVNVCDDICYYSLVGSYGGVLLSPTHAWSWVQLTGGALIFNAPTELETGVCSQSTDCPYGEFSVEFQVQNGECYDSDTMLLRFYEQPGAVAGPDQHLCNTFSFSLGAIPYIYCGQEGSNYWKHAWWELLSQPSTCEVVFDELDPLTSVAIGNCDPLCAYGSYVFVWHELNVKIVDGDTLWGDSDCAATDTVAVNIYEDPVMSAGADMEFCDTFAFTLYGTADEPCNDFTVVVYSWEKAAEPGNCVITFNEPGDLQPWVVIDQCDTACQYGEYIFALTQSTGYLNDAGEFVEVCTQTDSVSVTIFEQPLADAGLDVFACVDILYSPYCYSMYGTMDYCYTMYGVWTKSCGPGDVVITDINNPTTDVCFPAPGRYQFVWTLSNDMCEDADTVLFDLLETPTATAEITEDMAACDELCYSLADVGITKYVYTGVNGVVNPDVECPNYWDMAHWFYVSGPCLDPAEVTFAVDTDPATELCVSYYGAYTIGWVELNKPADKDYYCSDTVLFFVEFFETPEPFAGDDSTFCGNCYTLMGVPYEYLPPCNEHGADYYYWEALASNPCTVIFDDFEAAVTTVCIPDDIPCYGTYGFVLHESNGQCVGTDTVYITFGLMPDPIAICFDNNPNDCGPFGGGPNGGPIERGFDYYGCIQPNEVIEVCADGWTRFYADMWCNGNCLPGFDWWNPIFYGWTFEWSVIAPAGTIVDSEPGWYDFYNGFWHFPWLEINWGECCDTARIYLTITTPEGCANTMEYKAFVYHKPCVDIVGPDVSEVGMVSEYCNNCPPNPCLLYTWTAEHCGIIQSGQGTECIEVLWTDYNINGGWGEITLTVFDTCTGCCNYDEMPVKIWPTGTIGDSTLAGHVYYHNNYETPLNGVEIQLWNGGIPVQTTMSFDDIEGGNGAGYFVFPGINGTTTFGVTASYDAPWYGANATDALAVQLEVIGSLPGGFIFDNVVSEAMDVNNSTTISATDALWIKQRAISMVTYFPAGDWVFDPTMSASAASTPYDIYTLNAGDANRSNIPNSMKAAPAIDLITDGTMNVVTGQVFELPIRIADASQFGAITLDLGYNPALIQVVDVVPVDGMIANIADGNVSIAYSSVNPMILAANQVVVTLKVKAISPFTSAESLFSIGLNSEFADGTAEVVEPVTLKSFGVTTDPAATDYFLSANRPNPFSNSTFIEYTMPESGKVKLSVLDMLGQEIAVLVNATQGAGSYTVEFSAAGLSTGVYIYKITVDGETRDFISTQRMVISH